MMQWRVDVGSVAMSYMKKKRRIKMRNTQRIEYLDFAADVCFDRTPRKEIVNAMERIRFYQLKHETIERRL